MFAIRFTESLLARISVLDGSRAVSDTPSAPDTLLGDWYVERLGTRRLLCTSGVALLSVITTAEPLDDLPTRLRDAVTDLFEVIGVPKPLIARELRAMRWVQFAPATDPRVHAAMDRLLVAAHADAATDRPAASDTELAVRLGVLPIGSPFLGRGEPIRATLELFGLPPESRELLQALEEDWIEGASPD